MILSAKSNFGKKYLFFLYILICLRRFLGFLQRKAVYVVERRKKRMVLALRKTIN